MLSPRSVSIRPADARPSIEACRPAGVVFDLDGTIVDNLSLHAEAFQRFAERHRLAPLSNEDRARFNGRRNSEIFPVLFGRELAEAEWRAFEDEKEACYRELSCGRLAPSPGLIRLLDGLDADRIPYAVATSAPAENVVHTLGELGLLARLAVVVRGDEVPRGKPHPDVFLEAARRLDRDPRTCLAFEDAPAGVAAARRAGMWCVGIARSDLASYLRDAPVAPDLIVGSFDEFLAGAGRWLTRPTAGQDKPATID
jgi:HAD superfamily hydrolase (TIGR01509 family)